MACLLRSRFSRPPRASPESAPLPAQLWRAIGQEPQTLASTQSHPRLLPLAKACVRAAPDAVLAADLSPSSPTLYAPANTGLRDASSAPLHFPPTNQRGEVAAHYTPQPAPQDEPATL